jgi:hypothetical protein
MKFIDEIRQHIILSDGARTPIAPEVIEPSLPVRLATPIVRAYDKISRSAGKEIQPKPVTGTSMFGNEHKKTIKATRKVKLRPLQNSSEKLNSSASEFNSLAQQLAEQTEAASNKPWYQKGILGSVIGCLQSIGRRDGYDIMSDRDSESIISKSVTAELVQETDSEFDNISLVSSIESMEGFSFDEELEVKKEIDTYSLTKPELSAKEKSGFFQRFKALFTNCFSGESTENADSLRMIYGNTSQNANAWEKGEYVAGDTINYPSNGQSFQVRGATPPPTYEQAVKEQETTQSFCRPY